MHQSNDDNSPSGDQLSATDADPTTSASETAVPVVTPNHDLVGNQIVIVNVADTEPPEGAAAAAQDDNTEDKLLPSESEKEDGDVNTNLPHQLTKQRHLPDGAEVGAVQVNEQAPQVNRRFYLGLNRPSVRARNARLRQERRMRRQTTGEEEDNG